MKKIVFLFYCLFAVSANASIIDFEDLTTRNNFNALGVIDNYQGFEWGYGTSAGLGGRTFTNTSTGWASATSSQEAVAPEPNNLGGSSYAWNWNGAQSLWIDFRSLTNFSGGDFAILSSAYGGNASTVQLFGYDAVDSLVGASSILNLNDTFTTLSANFSDIQYLEIRANSNGKWFSIDNLVIDESVSVPEPASIALLSLGLAGIGFSRKKKRV